MARTNFQGHTPSQCDLLGVWQELEDRVGRRVRRSDLDAGQLRAHLANLSIIDMSIPHEPVVRLAGEAIRSLVGCDPRGQALARHNCRLNGWITHGLEDCLAQSRPQFGLRGVRAGGPRHAWLRLPLAGEAGEPAMVLCHDGWLVAEPTRETDPVHDSIHGPEVLIAA